jgi:hypothetical protein
MMSREKEVVKRFRRLNVENQDHALAIIQAVRIAEKTTQKAIYETFGIPSKWNADETVDGASYERILGLSFQ